MRQVYIDDDGRVIQWGPEKVAETPMGPLYQDPRVPRDVLGIVPDGTDSDFLLDGRIPAFQRRDGESTSNFAKRLVDGLYGGRE
jgi:hypothetical protein